jgi:hypothetical protein
MPGEGGSCEVSANEYRCTHEAQITFGDLTPYLTYESMTSILSVLDEMSNRPLIGIF